jgi:putative ABC transport system ATP-binding protein
VLEALAQVNGDLGTTTVVITHNVAIAEMADRVVRLADGQVTSVEERTTKKQPRELSW